ncbi:MAG: hypothetical protein GXP31_09985 [Kiritimatiellaeota bacterium]|nr:hypothetical protein [Kiritimatiellota bacterium]
MSRCAMLCQEERWREALLLLRQVQEKARKSGNLALRDSLEAARGKIEYSLRRQMAAALLKSAEELLRREFLLDVGE